MADSDPARLSDLLLNLREDLHIEIKSWLNLSDNDNRSKLAKELIALANHGGGFVILGFRESGEAYEADTPRPENFDGYNQDAVNSITEKYAEPAFHCNVHFVDHPESGDIYPIIRVPGPHRVPIRSKKGSPDNSSLKSNVYYIRRAGAKSEEPQSAQEWDDLMRRCVMASRSEMLDAIRGILDGRAPIKQQQEDQRDAVFTKWIEESFGRWNQLTSDLAEDHPARFSHGHWFFAYQLEPELSKLSSMELLSQLGRVPKYTGWSPFWIPTSEEQSSGPGCLNSDARFHKWIPVPVQAAMGSGGVPKYA